MNAKEQQRLLVLNRMMRREITGETAATLIGVSVRQLRRLVAAYQEEGAADLVANLRMSKNATVALLKFVAN